MKTYKGPSINDVRQIQTIFDTPPPIVTLFIPKACRKKILDPLPPTPVTSFVDDPQGPIIVHNKSKQVSLNVTIFNANGDQCNVELFDC